MKQNINLLTQADLLQNFWEIIQHRMAVFGEKKFLWNQFGAVSFSEVDNHSNLIQLAILEHIPQKQIGIGIFIRDQRLSIPAMLGVLKAADYFVFVDTTLPPGAAQDMIEDAEVKLILTDSRFEESARLVFGDKMPMINVDSLPIQIHIDPTPIKFDPHNIARILFTSGSTGRPKGVIEDYYHMTRMIINRLPSHGYTQNDVTLNLSSFSYSGGHSVVYGSFLNGGSVVFHDVKIDGFSGLANTMENRGVTIFNTIPTSFRNFVSTLGDGQYFPLVTQCHIGGEKRLKKDIQNIMRVFPNVRYFRLGYAGSEMGATTKNTVPIESLLVDTPLPVGYPLEDIKLSIWDEQRNVLPFGEEGEIVIYGNSLAKEYLKNPILNAERFIPDPANPGYKTFRTHDLGMFLPDGQLMHLGRIDNMVKIRGVRIELTSIETRLLEMEGIKEVAHKVVEDHKGIKKLVCYFTTHSNKMIPTSEIRSNLLEVFPSQQMPNFFIQLSSFPLTPSGKVDQKQLPAPPTTRPPLVNGFVPPSGKTERLLQPIWEDVLGISGIGATDDFFDLGGDSLLATVLMIEIEKKVRKPISVSSLIKAADIRSMAVMIDQGNEKDFFEPVIPFHEGGTKPPLFFIPGRGGHPTRIRFLHDKLGEDQPIYALQDTRETKGTYDQNPVLDHAKYFYEVIRNKIPSGQVHLIGESVGGRFAYEVARLMEQKREQLPLVFLLDTAIGNSDLHETNSVLSTIKEITGKHLSIMFNANWRGKISYLSYYLRLIRTKLLNMVGVSEKTKSVSGNFIIRTSKKYGAEQGNKINNTFFHLPYNGKVILIRALRTRNNVPIENGWDTVGLANLVVHGIDCYHGSILFEPAVTEVGTTIKDHLDNIG